MHALDRAQLARVTGGDSSTTTVSFPGGSVSRSQSDYDKCVQTMTDLTWQQYPDQRLFGIFGTDGNARPRAQAIMDNVGTNCGPPPK